MMIGKLPTLSSSRSLVTALFLYYDANKLSQKISKSNGFESEESPDINSPQKHDDKEVKLIGVNNKLLKIYRFFLFI